MWILLFSAMVGDFDFYCCKRHSPLQKSLKELKAPKPNTWQDINAISKLLCLIVLVMCNTWQWTLTTAYSAAQRHANIKARMHEHVHLNEFMNKFTLWCQRIPNEFGTGLEHIHDVHMLSLSCTVCVCCAGYLTETQMISFSCCGSMGWTLAFRFHYTHLRFARVYNLSLTSSTFEPIQLSWNRCTQWVKQ